MTELGHTMSITEGANELEVTARMHLRSKQQPVNEPWEASE